MQPLVNLSSLIKDAKCYELIRQHRWPDGVRCPTCDGAAVARHGRDDTRPDRQCYPCKACGSRFDDQAPAGGAPSLPAAGVVVGDAVGERRLQDRPAGLLVKDDLPVRLLVDDPGHLDLPVRSGGGQFSPMTWRIMSWMAVTCTPSLSG